MSKIICDICGTVYPDNASVCPICGYPRQESEKAILDEAERAASAGSHAGAYVKGGRFSSKNVKKRQAAQAGGEVVRPRKHESAHTQQEPSQPRRQEPAHGQETAEAVQGVTPKKRPKAGPGLKITVAVLAVAVIGFGAYIGYRFISGADAYKDPSAQSATDSVQTTQAVEETTLPTQTDVSCVGLSVSDESITFEDAGRAWILSVTKVPEDAVEPLVFTTSDKNVATVDESGRVTAVGPGTAVITITCGQIKRECKVVCGFEGATVTQPDETTMPTETTGSSQYQDNNWVMSNEYGDATLIIGEEFSLELTNDAGETADVVWEADREGVVSIDGNVIRGESVGMVDVTTTIDGKTYTCIVRVIENR